MLETGNPVRLALGRTRTPDEQVESQLQAAGPKVQEIYLLGVEPTLRPVAAAKILSQAGDLGMSAIAATNGAAPINKFETAFRPALERGQLHMINISLDSIDPAINNALRGKDFAYDRTMATINHAIETGVPIKVITTVWPQNYATVLDTVTQLYEKGVRGFSFHCGSLEGVDDPKADGIHHLDALAWRALCAKLNRFKSLHETELEHFFYPYVFFTKSELAQSVLGKAALVEAYDEHQKAVEIAVDNDADIPALPFKACPGFDVPQVYLYGNDGKHGAGAASLCSIHDNGDGGYYADFNPDSQQFEVRQDQSNQMQVMSQSGNLCPAKQNALKDGHASDRYETVAGDLFHACRYISSNQLPNPDTSFGEAAYDDYVKLYKGKM